LHSNSLSEQNAVKSIIYLYFNSSSFSVIKTDISICFINAEMSLYISFLNKTCRRDRNKVSPVSNKWSW